jgi:hypothetical protein
LPASTRPASNARSSGSSDQRSPNSSADHSCCIRFRPHSSGRPYAPKPEHVTPDGQIAQLSGHWPILWRPILGRSPRRSSPSTSSSFSPIGRTARRAASSGASRPRPGAWPFSVRGLVGPDGERWVRVQGHLPLSAAAACVRAIEQLFAERRHRSKSTIPA